MDNTINFDSIPVLTEVVETPKADTAKAVFTIDDGKETFNVNNQAFNWSGNDSIYRKF